MRLLNLDPKTLASAKISNEESIEAASVTSEKELDFPCEVKISFKQKEEPEQPKTKCWKYETTSVKTPASSIWTNSSLNNMAKRNSYHLNDTELGKINKAFEAEASEPRCQSYTTEDGGKMQNGNAVKEEEGEERQQWSNPIEFLLSCIAMSVGLGNVWRFPFIAYANGGGAFVIPYIIVLFIVGKPMYFMEMGLGQFTGYGPVKAWSMSPAMRGLGWAMNCCQISSTSFYTSIMALTVFYFFASFNADLPWSVCDASWGNDTCYPSKPGSEVINATGRRTSAHLYFVREVLKEADNIDDGIGAPEWRLSVALLFSWIIIFLVIVKGVQSTGKAAYFLALFPYVVLIVLLVRGVTLPGSGAGILYFITPQWDKLIDPKVWYAAVTQAFFSLGISFGSIIMYSSFNGFRHNVYRDALIVTSIDTLTSLLAGCTIFAIIGNLAHEVGTDDIGSVVQGGSGLAFITYPDAIAKFAEVPQLFAVIFFLMLFTLGVGSAVSGVNAIITTTCDQFKSLVQWKLTLVVCVIGFLLGLLYVTPGGQWLVTLVDEYGVTLVLFIVSVFQIVTVSWIYGMERFCRDLQFMLNRTFSFYWRICWAVITPIVLIVILMYWMANAEVVLYNDKRLPDIAYILAWILVGFSVGQIPFWIGVELWSRRDKPFKEMVCGAFRPSEEYGPKSPRVRKEWMEYKQRKQEEDAAYGENFFQKAGRQLGGFGERN